MSMLVTGGAGFIGSNYIRHRFQQGEFSTIVCLDKLSYAGNLENLSDVQHDPRLVVVQGDISDSGLVGFLMRKHEIHHVVNFAAESHVDRSLKDSRVFEVNNIDGALSLLEVAARNGVRRFLHISTDEVYGSIAQGYATEKSPLNPTSPYAKSKADADVKLLKHVKQFSNLDLMITRSSNNYGPFQHPEKFIPTAIINALQGKPIPLYGDGKHVRDWIHVDDNCAAIDQVLFHGRENEIYNIGGSGDEIDNDSVIEDILNALGKDRNDLTVQHVKDRKRHDRRYSIDCDKRLREFSFSPLKDFIIGLSETIEWYREHESWWRRIVESPEFKKYHQEHYVEKHGLRA